MKTKLVYGCPCSGKSTYAWEGAGDKEVVWDFDSIENAITTRENHTAERHVVHWSVNNFRRPFIKEMCANSEIDTLWILCHWPTDAILQDCEPCGNMEEIFISATREECYERLENDETRPDKEAWRAIIDRWFAEHGDNQETENTAKPKNERMEQIMNYEDYKAQRDAMLDEANALFDEGKIDEGNAKLEDVQVLDDKYDAISAAKANAQAVAGNARKPQNVSNPGTTPAEGVTERTDEQDNTAPENLYKTDLYRTAWAKKMMGATLTQTEANTYKLANEYTHTTGNTGEVIPESVAAGIWTEVEDMYPYYADIAKTYVNGILSIIQGDTSTDAAWYEEDTSTEDGTEAFTTYQLTGCELSRAITVSWKLKEMAIDDFIPYIQRRMAEKMGKALGYGMTNGAGKVDGAAPEPLGIVTALKDDANQVVSYTEGALGYSDITNARALIKSGYANGLAVYANAATIWTALANIKDENGRPIFVPDPTAAGVYKILGLTVKEDASIADGDILFSNARAGYQANVNKQISVVTEDHAKARTTDYCGYAIVDGAPLTLNAHALLTVGE